jgi:hypothetical protein
LDDLRAGWLAEGAARAQAGRRHRQRQAGGAKTRAYRTSRQIARRTHSRPRAPVNRGAVFHSFSLDELAKASMK